MSINGSTKLVFLAGDPVGHTRGYDEYAAAFAAAAIDAVYVPAHVRTGALKAFLAGLSGLGNVAGVVATVPHKLDALTAGDPDETARRAGSANVLRPGKAGGWECTQVDGAGFLVAAQAAGITLAGKQVQIVGAGGAGRAVAMAVASARPSLLRIDDIAPERRAALADAIAQTHPGLAVEAGAGTSDVLINCSTVGMGGDDRMPVGRSLIPDGGCVYDIVNRPDTPLLVAARARRCRTDHGRSMMLAEIPLIVNYLFTR